MKKKQIWFMLLLFILLLCGLHTKTYAADLDEITNYVVTVDPRMTDGTLDITYDISWKVLNSTIEGPLEWVQIGTPNSDFDTPTALSKNIQSIGAYNGSYVKIVFDRAYKAGETITFKYKIHQTHMYKLSFSSCNYDFTPAWFTDIKVDNLKVRWNKDSVKSSDARTIQDNYLVWSRESLGKGEKLKIAVKYKKSAFTALDTTKQKRRESSGTFYSVGTALFVVIFVTMSILLRRRPAAIMATGVFMAAMAADTMAGIIITTTTVVVRIVAAPVHTAAVRAVVPAPAREADVPAALAKIFMGRKSAKKNAKKRCKGSD